MQALIHRAFMIMRKDDLARDDLARFGELKRDMPAAFVVSASEAVGSRGCKIRSVTGMFEKIDRPRSPLRRRCRPR